MNKQWDRFHDEVDDIVPLAVRHISQDESDTEPHEDVTWVEKYMIQDLRKMQLEDDTTAQIIRWLEDDHKPSQAELALASPCNQILLVASASTDCVVGCGLLSDGRTKTG